MNGWKAVYIGVVIALCILCVWLFLERDTYKSGYEVSIRRIEKLEGELDKAQGNLSEARAASRRLDESLGEIEDGVKELGRSVDEGADILDESIKLIDWLISYFADLENGGSD